MTAGSTNSKKLVQELPIKKTLQRVVTLQVTHHKSAVGESLKAVSKLPGAQAGLETEPEITLSVTASCRLQPWQSVKGQNTAAKTLPPVPGNSIPGIQSRTFSADFSDSSSEQGLTSEWRESSSWTTIPLEHFRSSPIQKFHMEINSLDPCGVFFFASPRRSSVFCAKEQPENQAEV